MRAKGVDARHFFWPMHEQPVFASWKFCRHGFPVAERIARRGLFLPSGIGTTRKKSIKAPNIVGRSELIKAHYCKEACE